MGDTVADVLARRGIKQYNLEEEFGPLLDAIEKALSEPPVETLSHYGVKGMKWGKRKGEASSTPELKSLGPDSITRKTPSGETISLSKNPPTKLHKTLAKMSPRYREEYQNSACLTIKDSSGKRIGDAQVSKKSKDELNLIWLGIDKSERGKGYATQVMQAAAEFGDAGGFKKMTLEVPGRSPDARHIYEKLGFKVTGEVNGGAKDPVWGGLTEMEYTFDRSVKHQDGVAEILANRGINVGDDELNHYGIKGMKWGKRRTDAQIAAAKQKADISKLSDDELKTKINRLKLEQEYGKLTSTPKGKSAVKAGGKAVAKLLLDVGKQEAKSYLQAETKKAVAEAVAKRAARKAAETGLKALTR